MRQLVRQFLANVPVLDCLFRKVIWSRIHFPEVEIRCLADLPGRPFDVAIDVGAALGSYTWVLNRKAATVIAFEPGEFHYRNLTAEIVKSRVIAVRAAVGARAGTAELITPGSDNDARHMATLSKNNPVSKASNAHRDMVAVVSLDEYIEQNLAPGRRVDLLKIDVEGFENSVLEGAKNLIARDTPTIIAEIEARHNADYAVFFETLEAQGYRPLAYLNGRFQPVQAADLADMHPPEKVDNATLRDGQSYINNFVFQHPNSAVKVVDNP
jgi:FkbM family methyltransferase